MPKFCQVVMGPAGTGKSTYCKAIQEHAANGKRRVHIANLDPAAEDIKYEAAFDIRELITLTDVMEELGYGPNGGLVYCMEYLLDNMDWLQEQLDDFGEDEYIIFDCPGQIELYSHIPVMKQVVERLKMWGYRVVGVYLLDALFVLEPSKFISGSLLSLSCMLQLEVPYINVITKCDIADKEQVERLLDQDSASMINAFDSHSDQKLKRLTGTLCSVIDDYMMISFVPLDITDEESLDTVMYHTDHAVQYGEDLEPQEIPDFDGDVGEDGGADDA